MTWEAAGSHTVGTDIGWCFPLIGSNSELQHTFLLAHQGQTQLQRSFAQRQISKQQAGQIHLPTKENP